MGGRCRAGWGSEGVRAGRFSALQRFSRSWGIVTPMARHFSCSAVARWRSQSSTALSRSATRPLLVLENRARCALPWRMRRDAVGRLSARGADGLTGVQAKVADVLGDKAEKHADDEATDVRKVGNPAGVVVGERHRRAIDGLREPERDAEDGGNLKQLAVLAGQNPIDQNSLSGRFAAKTVKRPSTAEMAPDAPTTGT